MPKLNAERAKQVEKAEGGGGFALAEEGTYTLKLTDVEAGETRGDTPKPKWVFKWVIVDEGPAKGVKLWEHCALTDAAFWKLRQIFKAFGVTTDTDTDDLIGRTVKADVVQEIQQAGKGKGQLRNAVDNYIEAAAQAAAPAGDEDGDLPPY